VDRQEEQWSSWVFFKFQSQLPNEIIHCSRSRSLAFSPGGFNEFFSLIYTFWIVDEESQEPEFEGSRRNQMVAATKLHAIKVDRNVA